VEALPSSFLLLATLIPTTIGQSTTSTVDDKDSGIQYSSGWVDTLPIAGRLSLGAFNGQTISATSTKGSTATLRFTGK